MKNIDKNLNEVAKEWLEQIKETSTSNTFITYSNNIKNHVISYEKDEINVLKSSTMQAKYIQNLKNSKLSNTTKKLIFTVIDSIFAYAKKHRYIKSYSRLQEIMQGYKKYLGQERKEIQYFSRIEQDKIEKGIDLSKDRREIGILIALYTGLRLGEICALKWQDIDFESNTLKVNKSMKRVINIDVSNVNTKVILEARGTKSKNGIREVPIPKYLKTKLLYIYKTKNKDKESDYVVSKNGKNVHMRTMQNIFRRLLKKICISYKSFHVLRHTYASRCNELGIDPKTISKCMGHSNCGFTLNQYVHVNYEQKMKIIDKFENNNLEKKLLVSCGLIVYPHKEDFKKFGNLKLIDTIRNLKDCKLMSYND